MMSVDYYARLEQRRGRRPSDQMLASLARALRLTSSERDYLYQLAGRNAPAAAAAHVVPALLRVLDRLADTPALVLSSLGETLRIAPATYSKRASPYSGVVSTFAYVDLAGTHPP